MLGLFCWDECPKETDSSPRHLDGVADGEYWPLSKVELWKLVTVYLKKFYGWEDCQYQQKK